jgi:hypothetical protein
VCAWLCLRPVATVLKPRRYLEEKKRTLWSHVSENWTNTSLDFFLHLIMFVDILTLMISVLSVWFASSYTDLRTTRPW